jgi:hypothetical protein
LSSVRALVALGALGGGLAACGLLLGLDKPEGVDLPPLPPPPSDPCAHAGTPDRPAQEDEAGADVPPFWLALRKSYIGESVSEAGVSGFDLDGTCTCDKRANTAYDGGSACVTRDGGAPLCDFDGGIDNAVESSFAAFGAVFDANHFNTFIDVGEKSLLIFVKDYNGQANDLDVSAGFAAADGIYVSDCDPTLVVNDNPPGIQDRPPNDYFHASWRGCDKWHGVQDQFVGNPADPPSNVPKALGRGFVRDGKLVMSGLTEVPVFFGDTTVHLQDPTIVAPLERVPTLHPTDPVRFRIASGVVAGRFLFDDLAKLAFNTKYGTFYTCQNMATYKGLMTALCPNIDLATSAAFDHQGKTCSAMSFAFRFDADLADIDREPRTPYGNNDPNPCAALTVPTTDQLCPP